MVKKHTSATLNKTYLLIKYYLIILNTLRKSTKASSHALHTLSVLPSKPNTLSEQAALIVCAASRDIRKISPAALNNVTS